MEYLNESPTLKKYGGNLRCRYHFCQLHTKMPFPWKLLIVFWQSAKGQIISKILFCVLEFSQKANERICRSSKNEFVHSFFGKIRGYQKCFQNYLTFGNAKKILTVPKHLLTTEFKNFWNMSRKFWHYQNKIGFSKASIMNFLWFLKTPQPV